MLAKIRICFTTKSSSLVLSSVLNEFSWLYRANEGQPGPQWPGFTKSLYSSALCSLCRQAVISVFFEAEKTWMEGNSTSKSDAKQLIILV